jgi:hypothetical protein
MPLFILRKINVLGRVRGAVLSRLSQKGQKTIEGEATILGPSSIGAKSLIGNCVILIYPIKRKVLDLGAKAGFGAYDGVSEGSVISNSCVIRSGSIVYKNAKVGNGVETGHGF